MNFPFCTVSPVILEEANKNAYLQVVLPSGLKCVWNFMKTFQTKTEHQTNKYLETYLFHVMARGWDYNEALCQGESRKLLFLGQTITALDQLWLCRIHRCKVVGLSHSRATKSSFHWEKTEHIGDGDRDRDMSRIIFSAWTGCTVWIQQGEWALLLFLRHCHKEASLSVGAKESIMLLTTSWHAFLRDAWWWSEGWFVLFIGDLGKHLLLSEIRAELPRDNWGQFVKREGMVIVIVEHHNLPLCLCVSKSLELPRDNWGLKIIFSLLFFLTY